MATEIVYSNKVLEFKGKRGILKCSADGYYTVILGGLGIDNEHGTHYADCATTRKLIEGSSDLTRRLKRGQLYAEWGHPKYDPGMSDQQRQMRARKIVEDRVCGTFRKIWLETCKDEEGNPFVAIMGEIKPFGPFGQYLKESLDNPDNNTCFSGRYWSNRTIRNGQYVLEIHTVGTWDFVLEPGIAQAQKYNLNTLESIFEEYTVDPQWLISESAKPAEMTMESSGGISAKTILQSFGIDPVNTTARKRTLSW